MTWWCSGAGAGLMKCECSPVIYCKCLIAKCLGVGGISAYFYVYKLTINLLTLKFIDIISNNKFLLFFPFMPHPMAVQ